MFKKNSIENLIKLNFGVDNSIRLNYNGITNKERGDEMPRISLEAARVNAKLTQKELAEILGISNVTVVNWEKGITEPSASQLRKISELSGIPLDFIFVPDKFN